MQSSEKIPKGQLEAHPLTELPDFPSSYVGQSGKAVVVNDDEDAVEFVDFPSGGTTKRTQVFSLRRDWSTPTLDRMYYINFSNNTIEFRPVGTNNTIIDSLTGRNVGMFVAPYDCIIKSVELQMLNTGSFTGVFGIGSGKIATTLATLMTNQIVHIDELITSAGYFTTEYTFTPVSPLTILKGETVSPCMLFSAQASASKNGVLIQIEIEEVI